MPRTPDPWKPRAIATLFDKLSKAGFEIDARARDGLREVLDLGNRGRTTGMLAPAELLETMLDAAGARDGHAFRIASGTDAVRTACLVVRADYHRWVVGATACNGSDPTPGGCKAWKLPRWRTDDETNPERLTAWSKKFDAAKIGINFVQPAIARPRTPADRATEREMLRDIVDNPDDDGPRLVYADWLAERDPMRSEFIVVQCEAARLKRGRQRDALEKRASELRVAHADAWGFEQWSPSYHRGFASELEARVDELVENAELFATTPIEQLAIELDGSNLKLIAKLPRISCSTLQLIDTEGHMLGPVYRALFANCAAFPRLTTLALRTTLPREALELLAQPTTFPVLTCIEVWWCVPEDRPPLENIAKLRGLKLSFSS